MTSDEWDALRRQLAAQEINGVDELGRFVSNTEHFKPSRFDEEAAFPVFLAVLPTLNDPKLVSAVAGHMRRPWARGRAFGVLASAFTRWSVVDPITGWHIGDALGAAATASDLDELIRLARERDFGTARQMVVLALGRFKGSDEAGAAADHLAEDDDVALHALQALRKLSGSERALVRANEVARSRRGTRAAEQAAREARKLERLVAR